MDGKNPKVYRVKGEFLMGGSMQPFTMESISTGPEEVKEKIYSELGSRHRVKRSKILIRSVEEIDPAEAKDPLVTYMAGD